MVKILGIFLVSFGFIFKVLNIMKKMLIAVMASSLLAGCAPSYVRNDASTLSDSELCSRMGYAKIATDAKAFRGGYAELNKRELEGALKISLADCKAYVSMGAMEAQSDKQKELDAARAMNAELTRQQAQAFINSQNRPVTTSCSGFGNSVNCTTF